MKKTTKHFRLLLWLIIVSVCPGGCKKTSIEPVEIQQGEPCSYCKMEISEKRYAGEFIDSDGKAFKFDDIGCMVNFVQTRKITNVAAYFVIDFDDHQWLKAEDTYFVRSSDIETPMGGGLIAFRDQGRAQKAVDKYHGKLLRFKEVLNQ